MMQGPPLGRVPTLHEVGLVARVVDNYLLALDYLLAELAHELLAAGRAVGAGCYQQAYAGVRAHGAYALEQHGRDDFGRDGPGVVGADDDHVPLARSELFEPRGAYGLVQRLGNECGLVLGRRVCALAALKQPGKVALVQVKLQRLFVIRQFKFAQVTPPSYFLRNIFCPQYKLKTPF